MSGVSTHVDCQSATAVPAIPTKSVKFPPFHSFPLLRRRLHSTPAIAAASIDGFDLAAGVGIEAMHHGHRRGRQRACLGSVFPSLLLRVSFFYFFFKKL